MKCMLKYRHTCPTLQQGLQAVVNSFEAGPDLQHYQHEQCYTQLCDIIVGVVQNMTHFDQC